MREQAKDGIWKVLSANTRRIDRREGKGREGKGRVGMLRFIPSWSRFTHFIYLLLFLARALVQELDGH